MEKYILYGEIYATADSILHKGRCKGTIAYVGIYQYDCQFHSRVSNNASLLHSLNHDNVVQFLEWYQSPQHIWIVTELASGGTLADIMDADGPIPSEQMGGFVSDLAGGLCYVHSMGLVFCDLTPSKILLDAMGTLKLSDFSLAHNNDLNPWTIESLYDGLHQCYLSLAADGGETSSALDKELVSKVRRISSLTFFNPFYLSPEVLTRAEFSTSSDMWSLGCVIYELMMGTPPFIGSSPDTLKEVVVHQLPWIPTVIKGFSEMWDIVNGLLEKKVANRIDWTALKENETFSNLVGML